MYVLEQPSWLSVRLSCYTDVSGVSVWRQTDQTDEARPVDYRQARASHFGLRGPAVFRGGRRLRPRAHQRTGHCLPHLPVAAHSGIGACGPGSYSRSAASRMARGHSDQRCTPQFLLASSRVSRTARRLTFHAFPSPFLARAAKRPSQRPPSIRRLLSNLNVESHLGTEEKCSRDFAATDF